MILISMTNAVQAWGDHPLLDHADLMINEGERIGLIGRNGTGKSSLLKVLAGVEKLDEGVLQQKNGIHVTYVEQEPVFPEAGDLLESLILRGGIDKIDDEKRRWQIQAKIIEYLHRFGINESTLDVKKASGGEKKKAALSLGFALSPDLLLLDEPTNHLDIDAILVLEEIILSEFKNSRSLMTVTHDRSFLNRISDRIVELDRGVLRSYPGSFEQYEQRKTEELSAEETARRKFDKFWAQEEVWIRKGIEARRTRNEGRVRRLEQLRIQRAQRRDQIGSAKISLDAGEKSGKLVAELIDVNKSFTNKDIVKNLSLRILRGDKLGLLGPNGVGKTTFIKLILGQLQPDSGSIRLGTNLQIAYFDQLRNELSPEKTLVETVSPGSDWVEVAGTRKHVVGYLNEFLFPPHRVNVKVSSLSGGEKNRLLLAKLFAKPANLLVMDEPTNDLDIDSLELLEDTLSRYPGTVILVSHDRSFMDNVATLVIAPDPNGNWSAYVGGYDEWIEHRKKMVQVPQEVKLKASASVRVKNQTRVKLTYKETKELERLPEEIENLENRRESFILAMQSPEYSQKKPEEMTQDGQEMKRIEEELTEKYARWEELDAKQQQSLSK